MSQIHPLALDYSQRYYKGKYALIFSSKGSCTINTLKARAADQESMARTSALVKFNTYNCFAGGFSLTARSGEGFAQQQVVVLECWSWGAKGTATILCGRGKWKQSKAYVPASRFAAGPLLLWSLPYRSTFSILKKTFLSLIWIFI